MRGKGCYMQELSGETGITLAYAGKSKKRHLGGWKKGDHPRVCGEKLHPMHFPHGINRITPACAGKSALRLTAKDPSGDHPRMCGEKLMATLAGLFIWGSPPRVRGKG